MRFSFNYSAERFRRKTCQIKIDYFICEPCAVIFFNDRSPNGSDLRVQLNHCDMLGELFGSDSQTYNTTTGKRLYELSRLLFETCQPLTNARHKPRLAARITKRAALRH